jgi:hypothetical protein
MKSKTALVLFIIFIVFALQYLYMRFDADTTEYKLFPFNEKQLMSIGAYVNSIAIYVSILILCIALMVFIKIERCYLVSVSLLWIGFIIDFILTYNDPFLFYHNFPMSYSLYAGLFLAGIFGIEAYKLARRW